MRPEDVTDTLEPALDRDGPGADADAAGPTAADSFDSDEDLLEAELGAVEEVIDDDAELDDEVEFDTQFDETVEDAREMLLLQDLGIDLDDEDESALPLDFVPGLQDDDALDDEAAA